MRGSLGLSANDGEAARHRDRRERCARHDWGSTASALDARDELWRIEYRRTYELGIAREQHGSRRAGEEARQLVGTMDWPQTATIRHQDDAFFSHTGKRAQDLRRSHVDVDDTGSSHRHERRQMGDDRGVDARYLSDVVESTARSPHDD